MATRCSSFEVEATVGRARAGTLTLPHGTVPTPAFMPVGTRGTVRGIDPHELRQVGSHMVLANTYHLWERPGHERIRDLGGLHRFMCWDGPILTDSGGYQVFSLRDRMTLDEQGVTFRSPLDGDLRRLTPEGAIAIQEALGVDVAMVLDECLEYPATEQRTRESTDRTTRWLHRSLAAREHPDRTAVFGIVQGGTHPELRAAHAAELAALDLDGYAIGGLSVGEGHQVMTAMVDAAIPELPEDRVRYLMGVGHPGDLVEAVLRGVDLFDCVLPTRAGRHGQAYTSQGRLNLKNALYADDPRPIDPADPDSPASAYQRAYLRHLLKAGEILGKRLVTLHNLHVYQRLMAQLRAAIAADDTDALARIRAEAHRMTRPPPVAKHGATG